MQTVIRIPGPNQVELVFDTDDAATPAMVYAKLRGSKRIYSSTYDCALGTGLVDDEIELTQEQIDKLDALGDDVEDAFNAARSHLPEYS